MEENKNNSNLIRTDTFLYKIKVFFANLFSFHLKKKEIIVGSNVLDNNIIKPFENDTKTKFLEQLKVEGESNVQKLVRLLKNNTLSVEELTEEQKSSVISFLKEEIFNKKFKLQNIKNKKLYNTLQKVSDNNIDLVLKDIPEENKTSFIEYLKKEINIKKEKLDKLKSNISNT